MKIIETFMCPAYYRIW